VTAIPLTVPTAGTGTIVTGQTPTATDTIAASLLGDQGGQLRIQTTGTGFTVTISDSGSTPAGNATTPTSITMAATQIRYVYISPKRADPLTGLISLAGTGPFTGATYELIPA
jgi:hypothetical protein